VKSDLLECWTWAPINRTRRVVQEGTRKILTVALPQRPSPENHL
jgi:hypothetical protein